MTQEDKYVIEKLYIMDVKTLSITEAIVNEVDECKFALYNFMDRKCCYWLKGANIQNLSHSQGYDYPRFVVSKDKKSLYWLKESFKWLVSDIGFILRDAWNKVYDEKFDVYKHIK